MGKAFQRLPRQHGSSDGNGRGAVKEPRALQHRLRHQLREAEAEAAVRQDWALSMLAAEVAAEQRRALQQRLCHQIKEASGQLQEGAAEAGEAQTAV